MSMGKTFEIIRNAFLTSAELKRRRDARFRELVRSTEKSISRLEDFATDAESMAQQHYQKGKQLLSSGNRDAALRQFGFSRIQSRRAGELETQSYLWKDNLRQVEIANGVRGAADGVRLLTSAANLGDLGFAVDTALDTTADTASVMKEINKSIDRAIGRQLERVTASMSNESVAISEMEKRAAEEIAAENALGAMSAPTAAPKI